LAPLSLVAASEEVAQARDPRATVQVCSVGSWIADYASTIARCLQRQDDVAIFVRPRSYSAFFAAEPSKKKFSWWILASLARIYSPANSYPITASFRVTQRQEKLRLAACSSGTRYANDAEAVVTVPPSIGHIAHVA
jgi:hypothetical protein